MEYNFTGISIDTLESLEKKFDRVKSNVLDDITKFLFILNNKEVHDIHDQLLTDVSDIMSDEIKKSLLQWTECMNKVQRALAKYI